MFPKNLAVYFMIAGLVMISVFFLTSPPFGITNVILGGVPLILLAVFGVTLLRAKKKEKEGGPEGD